MLHPCDTTTRFSTIPNQWCRLLACCCLHCSGRCCFCEVSATPPQSPASSGRRCSVIAHAYTTSWYPAPNTPYITRNKGDASASLTMRPSTKKRQPPLNSVDTHCLCCCLGGRRDGLGGTTRQRRRWFERLDGRSLRLPSWPISSVHLDREGDGRLLALDLGTRAIRETRRVTNYAQSALWRSCDSARSCIGSGGKR